MAVVLALILASILTSILAKRIATAVADVITPAQNGFLPGRFICDNTLTVNLLQAILEERDEDAALLFLDQEKAFDRVAWSTINMAIEAIGFGPNIRRWVHVRGPMKGAVTYG